MGNLSQPTLGIFPGTATRSSLLTGILLGTLIRDEGKFMDMIFGSEIPKSFIWLGRRHLFEYWSFTPRNSGSGSPALSCLLVDFSFASKVGYNITNVVKGVDVQFSPKESGWMDLGIWFNLLGPTGGTVDGTTQAMMSGLVGSLFHENPRWLAGFLNHQTGFFK